VPKNKELLFSVTKKDFEIQTFRAGGKGGQNQNKRDTGVRIIHRVSGAVAEAREHRTQGQNKKAAFRRLLETPKWKKWHRLETMRQMGYVDTANEKVDQWMNDIKIEVQREGKWHVDGERHNAQSN
jgi:protein subunit release factor B